MSKIYKVGGAVRDEIMGNEPRDIDWLVVGCSGQDMLDAGFNMVGRRFGVYLHPETKEEYALASTIVKEDGEYKQVCTPETTIIDDLSRRDFTMNAIAQAPNGSFIDPFNGIEAIHSKRIEAVSTRIFEEDPIRLLRLARLAAIYPDFRISPETMQLARMAVRPDFLELVPVERVWKEISRALMTSKPSRVINVLRSIGLLEVIAPELSALIGVPQPIRHHPEKCSFTHTCMALDQAASIGAPIEVRLMTIAHDLGKALTDKRKWPTHHGHESLGVQPARDLMTRIGATPEMIEMAWRFAYHHTHIHDIRSLRPSTILKMLEDFGAIRNPEKAKLYGYAALCDSRGRLYFEESEYPQLEIFIKTIEAARSKIELPRHYMGQVSKIRDYITKTRVARIAVVPGVKSA